ncbi:MAG: hypothetical protein KAJ63_11915 [Methyloprofundus sp.]|nr:hypothetical protein [Methyloprofundus sp.]
MNLGVCTEETSKNPKALINSLRHDIECLTENTSLKYIKTRKTSILETGT